MFFFVPIALWALGIQSSTSDKRALAPFPHSITSWDVMDETAAYVNDHVPFRGLAIRWRASATKSVFGEAPPGSGGDLGETTAREPTVAKEKEFLKLPPADPEPVIVGTSDVMIGKDGWLFLTGELASECSQPQPRAKVVRHLRRLQRILARSGRTLVIALAPDKATMEPEHLPDDNPYATCSKAGQEEAWSLYTGAKIPGAIDTRRFLTDLETAEDREYYLRKDTHWNGLARAAVAQEIARQLDPALLAKTQIDEQFAEYTGDLTQLLGTPAVDKTIDTTVTRTGVDVTSDRRPITTGVLATITQATTTDALLYDGNVTFIADSFGDALLPHLAPFFQELTWIHTLDVRTAPATTAEYIAGSRAVVLVWAERYFGSTEFGTLWSTEFLDQLKATLPPLAPNPPATP